MILRKPFLSLVGAVGLGVCGASALAQDRGATLNYEGADLAAVARDVALRTGRIFVIDPRLTGRVNIVSPPNVSLSPDAVWEVFLATLQVNGFAVVPIGDREYKIVPTQQAMRDGATLGSGAGGSTVTRVVPLRFVDSRGAAANLRGLLGENGLVTPITESNSLIIVDTAANVTRLMSVIGRIDIDESVVRTIALENAAAGDLADTVLEIVNAQVVDGQRVAGVSVVPVASSNTLVLRGKANEIDRLLPIIRELDSKGTSKVALDTIYLDHSDAEQIVPILQQLIDSSFGVTAGADGAAASAVGGRPSIGFHKPTNSLIINAPPETQRVIRSIVSRLDVRRPQVLIEAVVVEITNNTARELGVQYVSGGGNIPISAASFSSVSPNILSAAGAAFFLGDGGQVDTRTVTTVVDGNVVVTEEPIFDQNDPTTAISGRIVEAAIGELLSYNGFLIGAGGELGDGSVYSVLLSAIQSDSDSNVLNVPSVVLLDNETATLQVGQEIPIVTGEAVGSDFQGGFRQIERKDVGNILEVTPQINDGNTVQLKIKIEISSIGAFTALTNDIITNKALVETVALAEDGQTLVIGGLIDNDRRETQSKVPVLGDIPLLGNLFKGQNRSEEETVLMVFIRPTILRDGFSADNVTARKYDYVRQIQAKRSKGQDQRLDNVLENYLGAGQYFVPGADGTLRPVVDPNKERGATQPAPEPIGE